MLLSLAVNADDVAGVGIEGNSADTIKEGGDADVIKD